MCLGNLVFQKSRIITVPAAVGWTSAAADVDGWTSDAAAEGWTSDAAEVESWTSTPASVCDKGWISEVESCISVDVENGISALIGIGLRFISIFDLFLGGKIGCSSGICLFLGVGSSCCGKSVKGYWVSITSSC